MHSEGRSRRRPGDAAPHRVITGIGCDVEEHRVIDRGLRESGGRWAVRVLATSERRRVSSRPPRLWGTEEVPEAADLWTAKEAVAKALGVGPDQPWRWSDVIVGPRSPRTGARHVRLVGTAAAAGRRGGAEHVSARTGRSADRSWATAIARGTAVRAQPQPPPEKGSTDEH